MIGPANRLPVAPQISDDVFERAAQRLRLGVTHGEKPQAAPTVPVYKDFDGAPDWPHSRIAREVARLGRAGYDMATSDNPLEQLTNEAKINAQVIQNLFGFGPLERQQTWPERMMRSAGTLAGDVVTGAEPVGQTGDRMSPHLIERVQDLAGLAGGAPLAGARGSVTLGSGMTRPAPKTEIAPVFYSATENAIRAAKSEKMSPEQWSAYLRNQPGVKTEELSWLGLDDPKGFGGGDKKLLTRDEMLDHAKEHGVQVKEIKKEGQSLTEDQAINRAHEEVHRQRGESEDAWLDRVYEYAHDLREGNRAGGPKYGDYQLPGGENYREMLFTLPQREQPLKGQQLVDAAKKWAEENGDRWEDLGPNGRQSYEQDVLIKQRREGQDYQSRHWDEPNVLAHVRMNDRQIPDVGKTLHLEELQSDWHQAGRKQGYKSEPTAESVTARAQEMVHNVAKGMDPHVNEANAWAAIPKATQQKYLDLARNELDQKGVPDAPFKTTWPDLMIKRMIREASENGYDAVSWTPGEAQAARYDLSKHIDKLAFDRNADGTYGISGSKTAAYGHGHHQFGDSIPEAKLADYVGKDLAEKIKNHKGNNGIFEGVDLKVGGEGMKAFYDKMLVDKVNAIAKKFGGKVEQKEINSLEQGARAPYEVPGHGFFGTKDQALAFVRKMGGDEENIIFHKTPEASYKVHVLRLPQGLRDTALRKGFPLFSAGVPFPLIPVDHDPFASTQEK